MVLPYPELVLPSLTTMNNLRDRHSKNMFFVFRLPDLQGLRVGPGSPTEFQHTNSEVHAEGTIRLTHPVGRMQDLMRCSTPSVADQIHGGGRPPALISCTVNREDETLPHG